MLSDYIEYVHIKDAIWETGDVVPFGMGDGNAAELIKRLSAKNKDMFLSFEPHLGDFRGFADLEEETVVKKEASGPEKFKIAYDAAEKIVKGEK